MLKNVKQLELCSILLINLLGVVSRSLQLERCQQIFKSAEPRTRRTTVEIAYCRLSQRVLDILECLSWRRRVHVTNVLPHAVRLATGGGVGTLRIQTTLGLKVCRKLWVVVFGQVYNGMLLMRTDH